MLLQYVHCLFSSSARNHSWLFLMTNFAGLLWCSDGHCLDSHDTLPLRFNSLPNNVFLVFVESFSSVLRRVRSSAWLLELGARAQCRRSFSVPVRSEIGGLVRQRCLRAFPLSPVPFERLGVRLVVVSNRGRSISRTTRQSRVRFCLFWHSSHAHEHVSNPSRVLGTIKRETLTRQRNPKVSEEIEVQCGVL